jgi:hypothetical protein
MSRTNGGYYTLRSLLRLVVKLSNVRIRDYKDSMLRLFVVLGALTIIQLDEMTPHCFLGCGNQPPDLNRRHKTLFTSRISIAQTDIGFVFEDTEMGSLLPRTSPFGSLGPPL